MPPFLINDILMSLLITFNMNTPTYNPSGTYITYAGLVAAVLTHFGVNASVDQLAAVISLVVILAGAIKQHYDHKTLAVDTGVLPTSSN